MPVHDGCPSCKCPPRLVLRDGEVVVPVTNSHCSFCRKELGDLSIKGLVVRLKVGRSVVGEVVLRDMRFCCGEGQHAGPCVQAVAQAAVDRCNSGFDFADDVFSPIRELANGQVSGFALDYVIVGPADFSSEQHWETESGLIPMPEHKDWDGHHPSWKVTLADLPPPARPISAPQA